MADLRSRKAEWPRSLVGILWGITLGLFLSRFFLVAESAAQGETLWIVGGWLLVSILLSLAMGGLPFTRPGWADLGVGLLAGAHIVAGQLVIGFSKSLRPAVNLAWEWVGVAAGWYLLRLGCRSDAFRKEMTSGLLAAGAVVAGLGLYQHYVEFPQLEARFGPLFDQLKNASDPQQIGAIRKKLSDEQIPFEGPALTLFEKRLRDSREPLGLFALANTLGGFLAVCLIVAVSASMASLRPNVKSRWDQILVWLPVLAVLSWCLLLTKSRTAWIGTVVGLSIWSLNMGHVKITKARIVQALAAIGLGIIAIWGLMKFGGLDRQVLTEAPKSLLYRLQYWSATWSMLLDSPLFGVGLGQFRSRYLFYKLPEASEEISDPHNLFLDVTANGGVIALTGLLICCTALVRRLKRSDAAPQAHNDLRSGGIVGGVLGLTLIGWCVLLVTGEDDRLLMLLPIFAALYLIIRRLIFTNGDSQASVEVGVISAGIALMVHLCGAGGIEMPAISLLLLSTLSLGECHSVTESAASSRLIRSLGVLRFMGTVILLFAVTFTAILPVINARQKIAAGNRLVSQGRNQAADDMYRLAAIADPLSEEPWYLRAELALRQCEETRFQSADCLQNVFRNLKQARDRDPFNLVYDRRMGEVSMKRWRVVRENHDAQDAVIAYERAWKRYPTNSLLMADLSEAYLAAGDNESARKIAIKALEQDRINRERGHVDRYLSEGVMEKMVKMTQGDIGS